MKVHENAIKLIKREEKKFPATIDSLLEDLNKSYSILNLKYNTIIILHTYDFIASMNLSDVVEFLEKGNIKNK